MLCAECLTPLGSHGFCGPCLESLTRHDWRLRDVCERARGYLLCAEDMGAEDDAADLRAALERAEGGEGVSRPDAASAPGRAGPDSPAGVGPDPR